MNRAMKSPHEWGKAGYLTPALSATVFSQNLRVNPPGVVPIAVSLTVQDSAVSLC
ncbi:hypothetical protein A2U01_0106042 [Trifolium medium]|uniref:Uncharacterized protein n=1 Tax=Trifolium medium TaxID=97028 RepID=A0A392V918_9FABA|nr:hypothetical protein [Trifolium medium]